MDDLGDPISYAVLAAGTPVYSSDGVRIGTVAHVLAATEEDIFDGIVIDDLDHDTFGAHGHRFVDAPDVGRIHERAVQLTIDAAACRALPEPSANPAEIKADPTEGPGSPLGGKLRRAWDLLSGNY
jgi:PRC-barrel domain